MMKVKGFEMERLFWIIRVGPTYHEGPYKWKRRQRGQSDGDVIRRTDWRTREMVV